MLRVWRLKRQRSKLLRKFDAKQVALEKADAPGQEFAELDFNRHIELQDVENAIDYTVSARLLDQARTLDIDLPPSTDQTIWTRDDPDAAPFWLTPKGRNVIRKAIDEEISRRRERSAWWWRTVIIPAITAFTGLAGVVIGIIAVLKK